MKPEQRLLEIRNIISSIGPMAVGFSAGVDSTLLLKLARDVLGAHVVAVTTVSASLPASEREEAGRLARFIGARHRFVESDETSDSRYLANTNRRCYFCKSELFRILRGEAERLGLGAIAYGAQRDDLGEFRPGMEAAKEYGARAPLLEAGLGKTEIRSLSRALGLPTWDKPAMACLSSRIPHGTAIDLDDLARVERAEEGVRSLGFRLFRVRAMGNRARVEIAREEMPRLEDLLLRESLLRSIRHSGFAEVVLDPEGYRAGGGASFRAVSEEGG